MIKQKYWIVVNGERYCAFDNIKDAQFMIAYLKARGRMDKFTIEAVPEEKKT